MNPKSVRLNPFVPPNPPQAAFYIASGGSALRDGPRHHYRQQRALSDAPGRDQRKASQSSPLTEAAQSCSRTGILSCVNPPIDLLQSSVCRGFWVFGLKMPRNVGRSLQRWVPDRIQAVCASQPPDCFCLSCDLFPVPCFLFPVPCFLFPVPCSLYLVPCFLFPVPCSMFPVSCSLFPFSCSLFPVFPVPCFLFPVPCFLFPVPCFLFPVSCFLFPVSCSLFPVPCSLFPRCSASMSSR